MEEYSDSPKNPLCNLKLPTPPTPPLPPLQWKVTG